MTASFERNNFVTWLKESLCCCFACCSKDQDKNTSGAGQEVVTQEPGQTTSSPKNNSRDTNGSIEELDGKLGQQEQQDLKNAELSHQHEKDAEHQDPDFGTTLSVSNLAEEDVSKFLETLRRQQREQLIQQELQLQLEQQMLMQQLQQLRQKNLKDGLTHKRSEVLSPTPNAVHGNQMNYYLKPTPTQQRPPHQQPHRSPASTDSVPSFVVRVERRNCALSRRARERHLLPRHHRGPLTREAAADVSAARWNAGEIGANTVFEVGVRDSYIVTNYVFRCFFAQDPLSWNLCRIVSGSLRIISAKRVETMHCKRVGRAWRTYPKGRWEKTEKWNQNWSLYQTNGKIIHVSFLFHRCYAIFLRNGHLMYNESYRTAEPQDKVMNSLAKLRF